MQFYLKYYQSAAVLMLVLLLAACTASQRVVKTYEGQTLPEDQLARLEVSEDIKIVAIDGVQQKTYLLDNLALTYSLLPGEHTIVYQYSSIWARPQRNRDADEANVDLVTSGLRQVRVVLQPATTYYFSFQEPANRREAEQLAANFSAVIVDGDGRTVAGDNLAGASSDVALAAVPNVPVDAVASSNTGNVSELQPATAAAGAPLSAASAAKPPGMPAQNKSVGGPAQSLAPANGGLSRLDAIKVLWSRASADEKKEFLRWAFQ